MSSRRNLRLRLYPQAFSACVTEAATYASCVACKDDVKKSDCNNEFQALKNCFQTSMKKLVTKHS